ncbi:HAMP domain-containing sensor histidine kinase [Longimicrobium sp.]|uniref:sensor histidine kinase n=1 Tax=Longimicrobium sp. TaxID=2029185 RepID=UPI002B69BAFD|nr:HAMP domain-containing sensor histidine kinase [Longimicrobium sp.]HSU13082.1 HAMP domain-containing sensor histidine kinase [Longimicrobium sp.]
MSDEVRAPAVPVFHLGAADPAGPPPLPRPAPDAEAQLSSFLAHELTTPVSTLVGLVHLLAEERLAGRAGDLAERALEAAAEVSRTVHELRALPGGMLPEDVDAAQAAAEAVRGVPCPPGVTLTVDAPLPGEPGGVRGHQALLARAIRNLVLNAVQAVGPAGSVGVTVRAAGDRVRISVWDDGPGVAPEHRAGLFTRPFTTRPGGSGLGLLLVRQVVEGVHGGTVSLRPRAPKGSIFHIELPRDPG